VVDIFSIDHQQTQPLKIKTHVTIRKYNQTLSYNQVKTSYNQSVSIQNEYNYSGGADLSPLSISAAVI
jgi:hypothetical protein